MQNLLALFQKQKKKKKKKKKKRKRVRKQGKKKQQKTKKKTFRAEMSSAPINEDTRVTYVTASYSTTPTADAQPLWKNQNK